MSSGQVLKFRRHQCCLLYLVGSGSSTSHSPTCADRTEPPLAASPALTLGAPDTGPYLRHWVWPLYPSLAEGGRPSDLGIRHPRCVGCCRPPPPDAHKDFCGLGDVNSFSSAFGLSACRGAASITSCGSTAPSFATSAHCCVVRCPASTIFADSCCLMEKCYRKLSTWGHPRPALFPAFQRGPAAWLRTRRRPACWP